MTKVTIEMGYKAIAPIAKELGINPVGKKTVVLVDMVNNKIDELEAAQKPQGDTTNKVKWSTNGFGYQPGEVAIITEAIKMVKGKEVPILQGRRVLIVAPAKTPGKVKGQLINPKTGEPQRVLITISVDRLQKQLLLTNQSA